jgi:transposase-like protein
VPKKKPRKSTEASGHSDDYKRAAVAEYLAQKGRRGAQQEAAKKAGISGPAFWLWVKKFGGDVKPSANGTGRKAPKERVLHTPEVITGAVARVLAGPKGTQARVAAELGVNPGTVSLWVQAHKAKHGMTLPGEARALASNGAAPHVPVSSALPPVPALVGLEKYIKALVAQQVAIEVRRRLRGMVG